MSNRTPRRSRAHLDAVLDGRPSADPLAGLVGALRMPAQPGELGGLDAAMSVFAAGPGAATAQEVPIPMSKSLAGRVLAVKILAVIAGAAATGGVAYAATSSTSSGPHNRPAVAADSSGAPGSSAPGSSDSASSSTSGSSSSASGSASESESTSAGESTSSSKSGAAPSPSLVGLCTAWLAHPRDIAKVSTNPAFSVLIKAAGGPDAVNGYCTTLLATAHPTHPAHPTQARNSSHPAHPSHSHPAHPTQAQNTKTHHH